MSGLEVEDSTDYEEVSDVEESDVEESDVEESDVEESDKEESDEYDEESDEFEVEEYLEALTACCQESSSSCEFQLGSEDLEYSKEEQKSLEISWCAISEEHEHPLDTVQEFKKAVRYLLQTRGYPDLSFMLRDLVVKWFVRHAKIIEGRLKKKVTSSHLMLMLGVYWKDMLLMHEELPEANLTVFFTEDTINLTKQYLESAFTHLLQDVSDTVFRVHAKTQEGINECLDESTSILEKGSMGILVGFRQLPNPCGLVVLLTLRDSIGKLVDRGFQEFFRSLDNRFLDKLGVKSQIGQGRESANVKKGEQVLAGHFLVLSQLSVSIRQRVIPEINKEMDACFPGARGRHYEYESGAAGHKFLDLYIEEKSQDLPQHKEPREVHMFVDSLLQELVAVRDEVELFLPKGHTQKHLRSDSNWITAWSDSNPRGGIKVPPNAQCARRQLLETHPARLLKEKIYTKPEFTQEYVLSTLVKLKLVKFQEFIRSQTFTRSEFQHIQLCSQRLRDSLKEFFDGEAAIDFLVDEVTVAAAERFLDSTPLEPTICEKTFEQMKLT